MSTDQNNDNASDREAELMAFLELLELNGERLSEVPEWHQRMQEILAQLPDDVVTGFANRIRRADGPPVANYQAFADDFDLTPTETKVLAALSQGLSLKQYAAKNEISFNTARVHCQRILEKTEAQSQTDLLRMLYTR